LSASDFISARNLVKAGNAELRNLDDDCVADTVLLRDRLAECLPVVSSMPLLTVLGCGSPVSVYPF
jgi:hypothetical protein